MDHFYESLFHANRIIYIHMYPIAPLFDRKSHRPNYNFELMGELSNIRPRLLVSCLCVRFRFISVLKVKTKYPPIFSQLFISPGNNPICFFIFLRSLIIIVGTFSHLYNQK